MTKSAKCPVVLLCSVCCRVCGLCLYYFLGCLVHDVFVVGVCMEWCCVVNPSIVINCADCGGEGIVFGDPRGDRRECKSLFILGCKFSEDRNMVRSFGFVGGVWVP